MQKAAVISADRGAEVSPYTYIATKIQETPVRKLPLPNNQPRKNPSLGQAAFRSIRDRVLDQAQGSLVMTSTGGGTGNGICTRLLFEIADRPDVPEDERTCFAFLLPFATKEPAEYVKNTIDFLAGPVSVALDSGNTGNMFLFSNRLKFEKKYSEKHFNTLLVESLQSFLTVFY